MNKINWSFLIKGVLAIIGTLACFVLFNHIVHHEVPDGNRDMVNISFGVMLNAVIARIYQHYFPTSGNNDKPNSNTITPPTKTDPNDNPSATEQPNG